jgi:hypothetical protein
MRTGTALGRGRSASPNRSPNTIVARTYGGGAEVLEPNWLFVLAEPHSRGSRGIATLAQPPAPGRKQ